MGREFESHSWLHWKIGRVGECAGLLIRLAERLRRFESCIFRHGGVAESVYCSGPENRRGRNHRGFESYLLRHRNMVQWQHARFWFWKSGFDSRCSRHDIMQPSEKQLAVLRGRFFEGGNSHGFIWTHMDAFGHVHMYISVHITRRPPFLKGWPFSPHGLP